MELPKGVEREEHRCYWVAALVVVSLSACDEGKDWQQIEEDRYKACIDAGGSYKHYGVDNSYECKMEDK